MVLLKDLPTLCTLASGNHTRPDNVFTSDALVDTIVRCTTVLGEHPVRRDHMPIVTWVDMKPILRAEDPWPNYRATNWQEFREELAIRLEGLEMGANICCETEFHGQLDKLTRTILEVMDAKVPKTKPSPYMKHWWSH